LNAAGHDVLVANSRGREGVRAFANEIGATAVDTRGAVEGVDVVVISMPFAAVAELPKDLFDTVPQDVPVIDTGNVFEPLYQALYPHWSPRVDQSINRTRGEGSDTNPAHKPGGSSPSKFGP
jgi:predicted dinucleotide-binding enzyme